MSDHTTQVARELNLGTDQVRAVAGLLAGGATIPFIARYRKEATGSLDEVAVAAVRDRVAQLEEIDKRRATIVESLRERGLLSGELSARLAAATSLAVLEDIYLPLRPKRRTRATVARERGLEPLADLLWAQSGGPIDVSRYVDPATGVEDGDQALAGARDILAERVSEDPRVRSELRDLFTRRAVLTSKVVKKKRDDASKFRDYFEWSQPLGRTPSHRILAVLRGSNEGLLRVQARPDEEQALLRLQKRFVRRSGFASDQVREALADAYKRLLLPALEREVLKDAKKTADQEAIRVFVANLGELLMAAPLSKRRVLAVDPGFRTGGKVVVLDVQGTLLHHTTVFPTHGERQRDQAASVLRALHERYDVEAVAIGNGTGGRETEAFVRDLDLGIPVIMVDESGASIYSASEVARAELPDHDLTVRGAVSIGRRLQDPLAELVKLDPKSIGVGQYQHDVDQAALKSALDDTVKRCVNRVGVDVSTASASLLTYVAGLGPQLARNIVEWRNANGAFRSRRDLMKVPRLGSKAFEQAAGFLRIHDAANPLDASGVHPERYALVERMARDQGGTVADLLADQKRRDCVDLSRSVADDIGLLTVTDSRDEVARPGRDPRPPFETFEFADVHKMEDLEPGMVLPGIVTNVTAFGAFVDVGVHQDGLVHVSQLADRFVQDPHEVVRVRQKVRVKVLDVDLARKRIGLSMRSD